MLAMLCAYVYHFSALGCKEPAPPRPCIYTVFYEHPDEAVIRITGDSCTIGPDPQRVTIDLDVTSDWPYSASIIITPAP